MSKPSWNSHCSQLVCVIIPSFFCIADTPQFEGPPVVHAVKDSSVIADLIQVGDKLVAVDDENVTNMTAIKVSKLISKKSANPSRKLTVIRTTVIDPEG